MLWTNVKTTSFLNETVAKPQEKSILPTKLKYIYYTDGTWSMGLSELNDYGPDIMKRYRYVIVNIDNFSEFGWTFPIKNKAAQAIKEPFENIRVSLKKQLDLIDTDDEKDFVKKFFTYFRNKKILEFLDAMLQKETFLLKKLIEFVQIILRCLYLKEVMLIGWVK